MTEKTLLCLGKIAGAHGVRGAVKVHTYTEHPENIAEYGLLHDASGKPLFHLTLVSVQDKAVIATISGIGDRSAAEALKGMELYVHRDALPETEEDEFYHEDLIGLPVFDASGAPLGAVRALHRYGAGDIIEIRPSSGPDILLPFTRACVPVVDVKGRKIVVSLPEEIEAKDG